MSKERCFLIMNKKTELKDIFTQSFEQSWESIDDSAAMPSDELEMRICSIAFANENRQDKKKIIRFIMISFCIHM